jgi:hypothetical protein
MNIIDLLALTRIPYALPREGTNDLAVVLDTYDLPMSDPILRADSAGWVYHEEML